MTFCVKMYITYLVARKNERIYEENILMTEAESFDEAYEKAEAYIEDEEWEYTNKDGEKVKIEKIEFVDCFKAFDEENGIREVYSCYKKNNAKLSEATYYDAITECSAPDKISSLRRWK